jgi:hypothetical protein
VAFAFGIGCTVAFFDLDGGLPTRSVISSWCVVVTLNPQRSMNTKTREYWASDPQARGLRIEFSAEQSLILPFDQFAFAELKSEGKQQHLRLVFATHEISIRGHALRRIETAMQRSELSLLTALSGKQRSLIPDGQPAVLEILVKELPCSSMHSNAPQE